MHSLTRVVIDTIEILEHYYVHVKSYSSEPPPIGHETVAVPDDLYPSLHPAKLHDVSDKDDSTIPVFEREARVKYFRNVRMVLLRVRDTIG